LVKEFLTFSCFNAYSRLPLILVGQSCRFAMIAVNGERRSISDPTSKTSLRSFLRKFGRRGNDALPWGSEYARYFPPCGIARRDRRNRGLEKTNGKG
jgi:hypothetical protein